MDSLLRKLWPAVSAIPENNDDEEIFSTDYSIAVEYGGPPVTYDIPQVIPVDISRIPVAAPVSSPSLLKNISLPVIQPIVKSRTSNQKSSTVESSVALVVDNGYESIPELSHGVGSSGALGYPGILDNSQVISTGSGVMEVPCDDKDGDGSQDYMNPTNSESTESCLSSRAHSSEIFSSREDDDNNEAPHHVKRPSIVTFRDPESADVIAQEECCPSENGRVTASPKVERNVKKGVCYRCLKGSRLTKKEVCIVCGAKYCHNCVLRAMGSMPEGRKCVTCIGVSIDEARRGMLGKYSTLLKRLLSDSEVKRIMEAEVFCQINQIPPELVYVNDEPLSQEELVLLQNSKNPPRNLRPGCYWYDRVSGFWGKVNNKIYLCSFDLLLFSVTI